MPAVAAKINRDDLLRKIFGVLGQFSELERNVFARSHYHGQSLKTISRSLKLEAGEVKAILRQCDRRLYASLREFRKSSCEKPSRIHAETAGLNFQGQSLKGTPGLPSKAQRQLSTSHMAI